jgi:hypothetical protein
MTMKSKNAIGSILFVALVLPSLLAGSRFNVAHQPEYTSSFMLEECGGFSSSGRNPFFVLEPGYKLVYEGEVDGEHVRLTIKVLRRTKTIDGVTTRVVDETETHDGEVVEIALNYFAICNRNNSVVYFGEDVDNYENGVIVDHDGTWRAGVDGARPGIIMPGIALIGARYFQEIAPDVALDRAEIIRLDEVVHTPAGTFEGCLVTRETTPLEPGVVEFKWYAPGIGQIQDNELQLVRISHTGDDDDDD